MATAFGTPGLGAQDPRPGSGVRVVPVPPALRLAAAARLLGEHAADPLLAAQRFLESAPELGVDLDLMWCVLDDVPPGSQQTVRNVALAVLGTGRTAMLFASGPARRGLKSSLLRAKPTAIDHAERVALIRHACEHVAQPSPHRRNARLAQSLLESKETDAVRAFADAGFMRLGDLAYLRRRLSKSGPGAGPEAMAKPTWPAGVRVQSLAELFAEGRSAKEVDHLLITALEQSYVDTQDCPELCGIRDVSDVLESHRSVGIFDPVLWWLVFKGDQPHGCMLLSACPEHQSVELVYLGLSPSVRGVGLGSTLLNFGIRRLYDTVLAFSPSAMPSESGHATVNGTGGVTCAVDTRNAAAMRLYQRAGFERFATRVPMVRSLIADSAANRTA